jgi:hypothetical protein
MHLLHAEPRDLFLHFEKKKIPMHGNKGGCATGEGD